LRISVRQGSIELIDAADRREMIDLESERLRRKVSSASEQKEEWRRHFTQMSADQKRTEKR
jgi:hypothetical protein